MSSAPTGRERTGVGHRPCPSLVPRGRGRVAVGVGAAVLAEAAAAGLLGLAGWFIASCAVAGLSVRSTFSYLAPSGGVRAFALTRIAAGYVAKVVLHGAALTEVTRARVEAFDDAAAGPRGAQRAGEELDRVTADAAVVGESLVRWRAPLAGVALTQLGAVAVTSSVSHAAAAALLVGSGVQWSVAALRAWRRPRAHSQVHSQAHSQAHFKACSKAGLKGRLRADGSDDPDADRARIRGEVATALDAWPEMRALGATAALRDRTAALLRSARPPTIDNDEDGAFLVASVSALTFTVAIAAAVLGGVQGPVVVLVALLGVAVHALAGQLGLAFVALRVERRTRRRLLGDVRFAPELASAGVVWHAASRRLEVCYTLPDTVFGAGQDVSFVVDPRHPLAVSGPSGIGKSTLLHAVAAGARQAAPTLRVVEVGPDDHVFTGTVLSNLAMGSPGPSVSVARLADVLDRLQLSNAGLSPSTKIGPRGRALSGGEQRRLHLARAILAEPDLLLADEPTSALDPATATTVLHALRELLPSTALVYSIHRAAATRQQGETNCLLLQGAGAATYADADDHIAL